jgi:hypothetical protein
MPLSSGDGLVGRFASRVQIHHRNSNLSVEIVTSYALARNQSCAANALP